MSQRLVFLSVALLYLTVAAGRAQDALAGSYSAVLSADDVKAVKVVNGRQLVGTWTLVFKGDGTFEVKMNDVSHVKGTFTLAGDELTLSDKTGDFACVEGNAPQGVYKITRAAETLTFEKVKDETCPGRAMALTLKPYKSS